jgi:proteasome lid subunit RPN8/RPN11
MPKQQVTISINAHKTLLTDIYERRCIEACGLLTGSIDDLGNWHIDQVHPLRNTFDSPVYFEFAPEEILAVELDHPGQVVGAYHSHPTGLAVASATDRENMKRVNVEQQIPWVWFIISGPFDKVVSSLYPLRRHTKREPGPAIIAYHHYDQHGLRQVRIQFEVL